MNDKKKHNNWLKKLYTVSLKKKKKRIDYINT